MTIERIRCCVEGCETEQPNKRALMAWVCPKHWSRLTADERRVWARIKRKGRRMGWENIPRDSVNRIWQALVRRPPPDDNQPG